ncbi:MAG: ornithine cyclodeaminase family protein [Chloroflexi bacterium AL-W]|nr:ornithine cyclodeaminase family protein [Chloroflexi bacterium AL-N1]NOK70529.1 ornithine cyclodeaminase family protein [Chloroflexi bacterium AL-N10]NOK78112.1 ornithine cyclodeaminase family protein [Chloroflexi bacterium AL-N5]NOK85211.1 ornithine cyclodeaminase family protein [Chloroflexi bacterium AL-W]NOK91976.1 ornithine cyclodeaminase family protein [Chloroflexi bacterium AL-N15]
MRTIEHVWVFDTSFANAQNYAQDTSAELQIPITACQLLQETVLSAEVIFTATWSREPFLSLAMVQPGCHITTLGPDEPGKCEVAADLIQHGLFVCDDRIFAISMSAVGGVGLNEDVIAAELGEVITGSHPGRTTADQITIYEITIYGGVGLAFQDLIVA